MSGQGQFRSGYVRSCKIKISSCQVRSDLIRCRSKSGLVRTDQVRTRRDSSVKARSYQFKVTSDQIMPGQVMSHRIRSCQDISVQVKSESGQGQVTSCHVRSVQGQVRYVGVRIWQIRSGWNRLGEVMTMFEQVM